MNNEEIKEIAEAISNNNNIVFFGGAGVSTASGIPDFRSGNGLFDTKFKGIPPETIVSHDFLLNETKLFYEFYFKYLVYPNAKPNFTHKFIAWLEKYKNVTVVTQNIDDLHQEAGSTKVIQIHGTTSSYHCMGCFKKYGIHEILKFKPNVPICTCSKVIRPDVTLYQEQLDEEAVSKAINAISNANVLIVCGSSLVVYPASFYINYFKGKKLIIVNKQETSYDRRSDIVVHEDMNLVFKEVKKILEKKLNEKK